MMTPAEHNALLVALETITLALAIIEKFPLAPMTVRQTAQQQRARVMAAIDALRAEAQQERKRA